MCYLENLNQTVFLWINASSDSPKWLIDLARFMASYLPFLATGALLVGWWVKSKTLLIKLIALSLCATGLSLALNGLIHHLWYHPRPFAMGLGHQWLAHSADSSFPSDHMTFACTLAFGSFMCRRYTETRLLMVAALMIGWARVYLGVHFPLDLVGSAITAGIGALVVFMLYQRTSAHKAVSRPK